MSIRAVIGCVVLLAASLPVAIASADEVAAAGPVTYSSIPLQSWRVNGTGRAVVKIGSTIYVGGSFSRATSPDGSQSQPRANLAAFDATTGDLVPGFRADTNGAVYDIQTDGSTLYIAGTFTTVGGTSRQRLAAIDPATGALRPGFRADADNTVFHLSRVGSTLYVGGAFTTIGGAARTRAAAVSTDTGAVDASFNPVIDGTVLGIAASPDRSRVYIGGPYTNVNGVAAVDISTLDGRTGATAGPELTGVTGYIDNLEVTPDGASLIAGHSGVPGIGNRTAVYSTATGSRRWRQVVDGDVQGIRLVGDSVFAGFHDGANGDGATRIARYDLASGTPDDTFAPSFDQFMGGWAIAGDDSAVIVAGSFSVVSGVPAQGFAIFPAAAPTPIVARVPGWQSWRYLDNGSDQGTAWRAPGFNDSSWRSGVGEFGYGEGDERTDIGYGPASNRYITTYFRTTFTASAVPSAAAIYMRVDDGAVVYLNGAEIVRDNLPGGTVDYRTLAGARDGSAEVDSNYFAIDPSLIHAGTNTVAVEVHQTSATSDDLTFFPSIVAYGPSTLTPPPTTVPPTTSTTTPTTTTVPPTTVPVTTVPPTTVPPTTAPPTVTTVPPVTSTTVPESPYLPAVRLSQVWGIRTPVSSWAWGDEV